MVDLAVPPVSAIRVERVVARSKARNEVLKQRRKISRLEGTASAETLANEREKLIKLRMAVGAVKSLTQIADIRALRKAKASTSVSTQWEDVPETPVTSNEMEVEQIPDPADDEVEMKEPALSVEISTTSTTSTTSTIAASISTESVLADINEIVNDGESINLSGLEDLQQLATESLH
jgi:hypothetical protein